MIGRLECTLCTTEKKTRMTTSNSAKASPFLRRCTQCITHRSREYVVDPLHVLRAQQDVVERLHPGGHDKFIV